MRSLSARTAQRALRLARGSQHPAWSSLSAAQRRRLCESTRVPAPPTSAVAGSSAHEALSEAAADAAKSMEQKEAIASVATDVLEPMQTPLSDTVNAADTSMVPEALETAPDQTAAASVDVAENIVADLEATGSSEAMAEPQGVAKSKRYQRLTAETPEEFASELKLMASSGSLKNAMWHAKAAARHEGGRLISLEALNLVLPIMARNGWVSTAVDLFKTAVAKELDMSVGVYNCALYCMTKLGEIEQIKETLDRMRASNVNPTATSYNLLITAYFFKGSIEDAFGVLQIMKDHLVYPTIATYQTLVSGCLRRRDENRAFQTLVAIGQQNMQVSAMTIAQVLMAAAAEDKYDHIQSLLAQLENSLPAYALDMERISSNRSIYSKRQMRTTQHYREAVRGEPRLELGAISAILHSAYRGVRPDIAIKVWNMLEESYPEYEKPAALWYCLIGSLARAGRFTEAFQSIGHMRLAGIKPNMRDLNISLVQPLAVDVQKIDEQYFALIESLEKDDQPELIDESSSLSEPSDVEKPLQEDTFEASNAFADSSLGDSAERSIKEGSELSTGVSPELGVDAVHDSAEKLHSIGDEKMDSKDFGEGDVDSTKHSCTELTRAVLSSAYTYDLPWASEPPAPVGVDEINCVISACAFAGDLDRAFQTYDEAFGRLGLERNVDTFNALLEGCVQTRHLRGGLRIIEEMEKAGLHNNPDTVQLTARLLLRSRKTKDIMKLIRNARENGVRVYAGTYQMLVRQFQRIKLYDEANEIVAIAVEQGFREQAVRNRSDQVRRVNSDRSETSPDLSDRGLQEVAGEGGFEMEHVDNLVEGSETGNPDDSEPSAEEHAESSEEPVQNRSEQASAGQGSS